MSEKEKKKRAFYRKNREKWIFTETVVAVVLALAILISSIVAYQLNKTYYIGYRESGSIEYNVFLKDNEFFEEDHLGKDQSYVASLIDKIIADYSYEIDMDTDDVNYKYSYTIKSRLEIIDDTSKVAIFNPERELVNVQNKSQSSSNRLRINEIVVINYDEYNDLASRFLGTYDLTHTTSNIVITLEVDVLSDCNAFSGSSVDTYKSELRIPLTTKTVNIQMTSAVPDAEAKMIACQRGAGFEAFKTTAIVLGVAEILWILFMIAFIRLTRTEDITYTSRVKKIVSQYKSYIQKINNMFDTHGYQRILVDTFDEMLEIRDTIQAPILMYENEDKTCSKFIIPTDSKLLYLYEIKIEGYAEPEPEHDPDPTPTTVVRPNITNVVRPVVKVVVNQPKKCDADEAEADISTVVEDAEVEVTADEGELPDVYTSVEECEDLPLEEDDEVSSEAVEPEVGETDELTVVETDEPTEVEADEPTPEENDDSTLIDADEPAPDGAVELTPEEAVQVIAIAEELEGDNYEDEDLTTVIDGKVVKFRYRKSFASRLIQADDRIKEYYTAVKNKLLSYKGVKARTSWSFESCNKGRIQCAKLNIRGKALLVYLNLNTENYNVKKYHFKNVSDKAKYEDVPMLLRVRSDRGLKYALELIGEMMGVLGIPEGKIHSEDYHIPYRTTEQLVDEGLIKLIIPNEDADDGEAEDVTPEVESILASIPNADDAHGHSGMVDAVDVYLGKDSTATYNPDGNSLERGDVVLVPTRDEVNDKDVIREAAISRGNYKVDPETLDRPLQKIIGVVKRKAAQIFTAMITPVDENED
ncbi:MAG: hypothetical protein IKC87_00525 [Clostridia bacterium]|nr:hypothetical protein [Clostridia bacterium]